MLLPIIPNQLSKIGFYFHIPFCPHICPYCDFVKTSKFTKTDITTYFAKMMDSLREFLDEYKENEFLKSTHCTVYFGGGTPSLFNAQFYKPLIDLISENFKLEEITIETNPFTNKQNFISEYKKLGINRVTLGAQSLCDNTLKFIGRKHSKKDILNNIEWLKESGIEQIQVDLIYGIKTDRTIPIDDEIRQLISAGATGISAYGLTIESRTQFGQLNANPTDEETAIEEYKKIIQTCDELGLRQIETSNFSFFDAKHNNLYWYGYPYFGIGTGAHGLLPTGERYKVGVTPKELAPGDDDLKFKEKSEIEKNFEIVFEGPRNNTEILEELIFTLLRTERGIPLDWLTQTLQIENIEDKILQNPPLKRGIEEGKVVISSSHLMLHPFEKIRGDAWALTIITCLL